MAADPPPDGLVVRGGPSGTTARLDDLESAAMLLRDVGLLLATVAGTVVAAARDPQVVASTLLSPTTGVRVEAALLSAALGPVGAAAVGVHTQALGVTLGAVVAMYRVADGGTARLVHQVDQVVGEVVGRAVATGLLAVPGLAPGLGLGAAAGWALGSPSRGSSASSASSASAASAGVDGGQGGVGERALEVMARHTGTVEHAVDIVAAALDGFVSVAAPSVAALSGTRSDPRGTANRIQAIGRLTPALRETAAVRVVSARSYPSRPPAGVGGILQRVVACSPGTIRVDRVTAADGRRAWAVAIPGTDEWSPRTGADPFDLTSDVQALAGDTSAVGRLVIEALRSAGVRPGESVLLAGHSLGGMVAAQLAADPLVRKEFRITNVVTAGSPVALSGVPRSISVLSLEHTEDLVPRLDGGLNPDRPSWVTVSRPVTAEPASGSSSDDVRPEFLHTHGSDTYAQTGALIDRSTDPAVVAGLAGLGAFIERPGAGGHTVEVIGERVVPRE